MVPYALEAIGYINYSGDNIRLDVSRNSIISGYKELQYELSVIILKYIKENKSHEKDLKIIIDGMIDYLINHLKGN